MADDLLAELRGLHQPPPDAGTLLADGTVALAVGLLAAWVIVLAVTLLTVRSASPEQAALRRLADVAEIMDNEGLTARARLLQDLARALPSAEEDWLVRVDRHLGGFLSEGPGKGLREALYRPGSGLDLDRFDDELRVRLQRVDR